MARPEQVSHGSFYHKIVRVYPERINCEHYREECSQWTQTPCTLTDDEIRQQTVEHAKKLGYSSGDTAKVVMVSRMGDCGLTKNPDAASGYDFRITPEYLVINEWVYATTDDGRRILYEIVCDSCDARIKPHAEISASDWVKRGWCEDTARGTEVIANDYCPRCAKRENG